MCEPANPPPHPTHTITHTLAQNIKITLFVTHNMRPLPPPPAEIPEHSSQQGSDPSLIDNEQESFYVPAVALVCHAQ